YDKLQGKIKKRLNRMGSYINNVNENDLDKYVNKKKKEIIILLKAKALKPGQVHELRKRLKKLYYNQKSLKVNDSRQSFKNGNALQKMMGKWHDTRVMNRHLMHAVNKCIVPSFETTPILKMADDLYAKSQNLYKQIHAHKRKIIF